GEGFFQHRFPHERSDLIHWRQLLSSTLELLLAESLRRKSRRQVKLDGGYVSANHTAAKTGRVAVCSTSTGPARKSMIMGPHIVQDGGFDLPKCVNDLTYDVNNLLRPSYSEFDRYCRKSVLAVVAKQH